MAASTKTMNQSGISFKYPSSWAKLPKGEAKSLGGELVADAQGVLKLSRAAGVDLDSGSHGAVAILAKLSFTAKYQKALKGNREKFYQRFVKGIKSSASTKDLKTTTGSFAGSSKAYLVNCETKTQGSWTADEFLIYVPQNNKSVDMGIFAVLPASSWHKYSSDLKGIATSSKFS